jgi:hypothetical protein
MKEAWPVWRKASMGFERAVNEVLESELSLDDASRLKGAFRSGALGLVVR